MSKLVDAVNWMSTWTYMNIKGQGHSLTLEEGHSDQHFQTSFPEKLLDWLKPNFMWILPCDGGTKICSNGPGHMTMMAAMPTYGKDIKNSSSL